VGEKMSQFKNQYELLGELQKRGDTWILEILEPFGRLLNYEQWNGLYEESTRNLKTYLTQVPELSQEEKIKRFVSSFVCLWSKLALNKYHEKLSAKLEAKLLPDGKGISYIEGFVRRNNPNLVYEIENPEEAGISETELKKKKDQYTDLIGKVQAALFHIEGSNLANIYEGIKGENRNEWRLVGIDKTHEEFIHHLRKHTDMSDDEWIEVYQDLRELRENLKIQQRHEENQERDWSLVETRFIDKVSRGEDFFESDVYKNIVSKEAFTNAIEAALDLQDAGEVVVRSSLGLLASTNVLDIGKRAIHQLNQSSELRKLGSYLVSNIRGKGLGDEARKIRLEVEEVILKYAPEERKEECKGALEKIGDIKLDLGFIKTHTNPA